MDKKAKVNLVGWLVVLVLLGALLPTIRSLVTTVQVNGSAAEIALYGILTVVIAIAVIVGIIKESGIQSVGI